MIFDVDKDSADRSSPSPNTHDTLPTNVVMAKNTVSTSYQTPSTNQTSRIQMLNSQILSWNDDVAQILIGPDSTGTEVMKVAKTGFDARTATGSELIFNSNQDVFKIVEIVYGVMPGNTSLTAAAGNYATSLLTNMYPHNLGYIPTVQAFLENGSSYTPLPYSSQSGASTAALWTSYIVGADATNIYLSNQTMCTGESLGAVASIGPVKVYILQETAN